MTTTERPRLLDLFCGAGGAAMGYHRAGFDVVGVDINPQPNYPFPMTQCDALQFFQRYLGMHFDAIHASPPCQHYSITKHSHDKEHPDLLGPTRDLLQATGLPYVIENVVGAPMIEPLTLCGTQFNLRATDDDGQVLWLRRHRLFESNVFLMAPGPDRCSEPRHEGIMCGGVYDGGPANRKKDNWGDGDTRRGGYTPAHHVRAELLGIDWITGKQINQAIPPAYTEFIGQQLMEQL